MADQTILPLLLGSLFVGTMLSMDQIVAHKEHFGSVDDTKQKMRQALLQKATYPAVKQFYAQQNEAANAFSAQMNPQATNVQSNRAFAGPPANIPQSLANINLSTSGDQLLEWQLYQQAINASTPTQDQLNAISGYSNMQTGDDAVLRGGLSSNYAPYSNLGSGGPELYSSEFQAVNLGNARAQQISACAQNAPTFVATSLLPKPTVPGQESWETTAPQSILASQNFLAATQQLGVDTVASSLRNPSYDIRTNIPNPINVVSPWMNTTIDPELEKRPLDCYIPQGGVYGCANSDLQYVGMTN